MNDSFLNSSNAPYVAELFFKFRTDKKSVDKNWINFFNSLNEDEISVLGDFGGPLRFLLGNSEYDEDGDNALLQNDGIDNNGDGVILPSVEPSVFELKNPNKNVKGEVL